MSHFSVLVIGDNVEEQLEPFNENLSVAPYVDEGCDHDNTMARALSYYAHHPEIVARQNLHTDRDKLVAFLEGETVTFDEDGISSLTTTYNPHSKWDWWMIGGRFNQAFVIKDGVDPSRYAPLEKHWTDEETDPTDSRVYSDSALLMDIDFEVMREQEIQDAEKAWAQYAEATRGMTPPDQTWEQFRGAASTVEEAREKWNNLDWVKTTRGLVGFFSDAVEVFKVHTENPYEAYMEEVRGRPVVGAYALLKDGEWFERGSMGWWGLSSNEMPTGDWNKQVQTAIDELDPHTRITMVDCHI